MSIPHVGWPVGADADEPSGRGGAQTSAGAPEAGGDNATAVDRGARESRRRPGGSAGRARSVAGPAVSVLADRLAAALVHHEPGWRLPRQSALARRYNVSAAEIDTAVGELTSRHLVRRLADGQVYRASPAEYVIELSGIPGLTSHVDAMGAEFSCRSRQVRWRLPPEDISWALAVPADQQVCVVRYLWTADGAPAALSTTYVPADLAVCVAPGPSAASPNILNLLEPTASAAVTGAMSVDETPVEPSLAASATALHIEMQAPPPSVARSLRLTAGQPAVIVTVRFNAADTGRPVVLTVAVLRPEMFRVVLQTPSPPLRAGDAGGLSGPWTHAIDGWES